MSQSKYISTKETVQLTGLSTEEIYDLIHSGRLSAHKAPKSGWRISPQDLAELGLIQEEQDSISEGSQTEVGFTYVADDEHYTEVFRRMTEVKHSLKIATGDFIGFVDSDVALQNVVMACNWLVGRQSEKLSYDEQYEEAFYISPAGALAGMMYDEATPISQGRAGKKYGTVSDVKGVKLDLLKSEIASLMDDHVVPMVFSEGRVMAFNNNTLYNGDLDAMMEYPIVRVFDWIKKVLMNYVHEIALENWDPYTSPKKLKDKIQDFLNHYQGYQNFFSKYKLGDPKQDPKTKIVSVDISITPFFAAKNFVIKLEADNKDYMGAETSAE